MRRASVEAHSLLWLWLLAGFGATYACACTARAQSPLLRAMSSATSSHVIRPPSSTPLTVTRLDPGQGCSAVWLGTGGRMPVITRARPAVLQVTVDTRLMPEAALDGPLATGEFRREVRIYGKGDDVHPAVVVPVVGRVVGPVYVDPPRLELGGLPSSGAQLREFTVWWDAKAVKSGTIRFADVPAGITVTRKSASDGLTRRREDAKKGNRKGAAKPSAPTFHFPLSPFDSPPGYRATPLSVSVAPNAAAGPLGGVVVLEAELRSGGTCRAWMAVSGELLGSVVAQPPAAVFGAVGDGEGSAEERAARRTRWVLLISRAAKTGRPPVDWSRASVASAPTGVEAAIVLASAKDAPPLRQGFTPRTACWLKVVVRDGAAPGASLYGDVVVKLPRGERLRVPVLGSIAGSLSTQSSQSTQR